MKAKFNYPGDPEFIAQLMFGAEFVSEIRHGEQGFIQVGDDPPMYFDEVLCDLCNAEIGQFDPCMLVANYLYCWGCAADKLQYLS